MNKKVRNLLIILLVLIEIGAIFLAYKSFDNKDKIKKVNLTESNNSLFAIMVEQEDGTFKEESSWPGSNYIYEESMSGCVDSSGKKIEDSLIYDPETNTVILETEYTTHCYLYFKAPEQKYFEGVRYIKDCIYGNNKNEYNTWVEIQALKDGTNVVLNKSLKNNTNTYVTDGNTSITENTITATYDTVSNGTSSDYGDGDTIEKVYFNTSGVSVGDTIYFEFKVKAVNVISTFNYSTGIGYSVDTDGDGLTIVDGTIRNHYVYGTIDVTQDMINNNEILLEIETISSSSVTPVLMIRNPNYLISRNTSCVTVDLGETYDLDEIKVWHYYKDGRSYNKHTLSTSSDNSTWTKLINSQSGVTETSEGISVLPE